VHLANTGNVGLQQVSLDSPTSVCATADLQPGAAPHSCQVLFASGADDFEQGFMWRNVSAHAQTKANVPVSGQTTQLVSLVASRRLSMTLLAEPIVVTRSGEMNQLKCSQLIWLEHKDLLLSVCQTLKPCNSSPPIL